MNALVNMVIICWTAIAVPHGKPVLREVWRIEKLVTLENCLIMNRTFTGGGVAGAVTVKCGDGFKWRDKS